MSNENNINNFSNQMVMTVKQFKNTSFSFFRRCFIKQHFGRSLTIGNAYIKCNKNRCAFSQIHIENYKGFFFLMPYEITHSLTKENTICERVVVLYIHTKNVYRNILEMRSNEKANFP